MGKQLTKINIFNNVCPYSVHKLFPNRLKLRNSFIFKITQK